MHQWRIRFSWLIKRPLFKWIVSLVFVAVVVLFTFRQVGNWLVVADAMPDRIDIICTFAGENQRVDYSKQLMLQHSKAHWFLSDYKDGHGRLLQKNHFDMRRVSIVDTCKSTLSEITAITGWLNSYCTARNHSQNGQKIYVALISSPYHMRRIKIMAQRRIKIDNVKLFLIPVPYKNYQWSDDTFRYWWRSNQIISLTTMELLKIGYFLLTGFFK